MRNGQWVLFEKCVIGDKADPYMIRWRLFECPWFRVYLHHIRKSDEDRHLHDHPFNFLSIILWGGYREWTGPHGVWYGKNMPLRKRFVFRKATDFHRLELSEGPVWSLFIAGRRIKEWGFDVDGKWVHWKEYLVVDSY